MSILFTIVTGASSNHFKSLCQMLNSVKKHEPTSRVVVYDLGLTVGENEILSKNYPTYIHKRFDYSRYPAYFNIHVRAGEYAWKPVIIHTVAEEFGGCVIWLDAGCVLTRGLNEFKKTVLEAGVYTPISRDFIPRWTHPKTVQYMTRNMGCNYSLYKKCRAGGIVGFNTSMGFAKKMLQEWKDCALVKECIAPVGSSRENHRQDQAVLTMLYYKYNETVKFKTVNHIVDGLLKHQDIG